ncbi:hypothetical protein [Paraburkholderia sp. BR14374]|uniref:hypothetical protein n=1 Tax=Paraburkholderia sp. BR14374 TaxID=3237007 RepID=UPI0034CE376A
MPFLLLGPLAKLGYFEALDAVLDVAELSREATHFARVLAYKVLDPPERGWRRSPGSIVTATAFAGQRIPIGEEGLTQFAHRIAPHTGLLDRLLADALVRGYTRGTAPMLWCAQDEGPSGFLLTDVDGCFPIVWVDDLATLPNLLKQLGSAVLLVCGTGANSTVLSEVAKLGLSFVTVLAPTRGEPWREIRQGPVRLGWTNHEMPSSVLVLQAACNLASASDESNGLWEALAVQRPGIVCADRPMLECTATLAAATAAGTIAWELWRNRERTTPQAVLQYFKDFDANIRFTDESVSVRLPMGRRRDDLSRAGLLDPVSGIPWFRGRVVEFGVA